MAKKIRAVTQGGQLFVLQGLFSQVSNDQLFLPNLKTTLSPTTARE